MLSSISHQELGRSFLCNIPSLVRTFCLRCKSRQMASFAADPVEYSRMTGYAIIPSNDGLWMPFDSSLEVGPEANVVVQELQQCIAFFLFVPNNVSSKLGIDEEGLLSSSWVRPHDRMLMLDRFSPYNSSTSFAVLRLLNTRMNGFEAMQSFFETRAESFVRLHLVHKDRVPASGRLVKNIQECCSRWLLFVGNVAVPCYGGQSLLQELLRSFVSYTSMHKMDFRITFGASTDRMNVVSSEISSKLQGLVDR